MLKEATMEDSGTWQARTRVMEWCLHALRGTRDIALLMRAFDLLGGD